MYCYITCPRKKYWRAPLNSCLCFPGYFSFFTQCLNWKAVCQWFVISVRTCIAWVWEVVTVSRVNWQNEQLAAGNSNFGEFFLSTCHIWNIICLRTVCAPLMRIWGYLRVHPLPCLEESKLPFGKQVTVTFLWLPNVCCMVINLPQLTFNWNSKPESQLIVTQYSMLCFISYHSGLVMSEETQMTLPIEILLFV